MRLFFILLLLLATRSSHALEPSSANQVGLSALSIAAHEIHPALTTPRPGDGPVRHLPSNLLLSNPQISSDLDFVNAIARSGSQGNLDAHGVRSALYALYRDDKDVGLYGLEAATTADANRLEQALHKIWAHNISIQRAQIHRQGLVLVVAWHDGVSPEVWDAVNVTVRNRLGEP